MHRKITLDVEQLHVDSFEPQPEATEQSGTVRGYWTFGCDTVNDRTCNDLTCNGYGTCGVYPCKGV